MEKNHRKLDIAKIFIFLGIIFLGGLATLINYFNPDEYLYYENKTRTSFPEPSFETIRSGEFRTQFQESVEDHFIFREKFLFGKTWLDKNLARKPKLNDSVLGKNGDKMLRFREGEETLDSPAFYEGLDQLKEISQGLDEKGIPFLVVGATDQSYAFYQDYPPYMQTNIDYHREISDLFFSYLEENNIDSINLEEAFSEDFEKYYYDTDHHFNLQGAVLEYQMIIDYINQKTPFDVEVNLDQMKFVEDEDPFLGSNNRKAFGVLKTDEHLWYAEPKEEIAFRRFENGEEVEATINTDSQLYASYMGGDKTHTQVQTDRPEKPDILIVGDSTTNILESILWMNADQMTSIDYRHFDGPALLEYIDEHPQDIVIFTCISGYYDDISSVIR